VPQPDRQTSDVRLDRVQHVPGLVWVEAGVSHGPAQRCRHPPRTGPTAEIVVSVQGHYSRFVDMAR